MSKASKRQKLTKEEIHSENEKLRKKVYADNLSEEDSKRIVETLSKRNLLAYAMVVFLPPVGIWYVWTRREKLYLNRESVYLWTFVGCVIFYKYLEYIWTMISAR